MWEHRLQSQSQQCYFSSFLLKDSTGVWPSLFHKNSGQSSHSSWRTNKDHYIHFLLSFCRSTKLFGPVPLYHSERNRYNSCKAHLNIIAFSGKREHHLIETWSSAQFREVSATQLGYSWHPSAAASILTQDSNSSQPRRKYNSFRRSYHAKNRMSIFHRKSSCCLIQEQNNLQLSLNERAE